MWISYDFKRLPILKGYSRAKDYGEMGKRMTDSFPLRTSQPGKQMAKEGHN